MRGLGLYIRVSERVSIWVTAPCDLITLRAGGLGLGLVGQSYALGGDGTSLTWHAAYRTLDTPPSHV